MTEVQSPRRVSRSQVHDEHLPSLPRVPAVQVPLLRRYYEDVRLPASLSPRFVALRVTIPSAAPVVRSLRSRTPNRGPGVHNPVPLPEIAPGDVQGLPSSWGALVCLCHVLRPRRDRTHQALAVCRRGPRGVHTEGSPRVVLSRLNSTALALAVYASQWSLLAPTQDSLPAAGQALPGGIGLPTRLLRKVSDRCHPPFPSFLGARTSLRRSLSRKRHYP